MRTIACEIAERIAPSIGGAGSDVSVRGFSPSPRSGGEAASSMLQSSPPSGVRNRTAGSGALEAHGAGQLGAARVGRLAQQQPLAVGAPLELPARHQLAERGGYRG